MSSGLNIDAMSKVVVRLARVKLECQPVNMYEVSSAGYVQVKNFNSSKWAKCKVSKVLLGMMDLVCLEI